MPGRGARPTPAEPEAEPGDGARRALAPRAPRRVAAGARRRSTSSIRPRRRPLGSHCRTVRFAWLWTSRRRNSRNRIAERDAHQDPVGRGVPDREDGRSIRCRPSRRRVAARNEAFACHARCSSRRSARNDRTRTATSSPDSPPGHGSWSGSASQRRRTAAPARRSARTSGPPRRRSPSRAGAVRLDRASGPRTLGRLARPEQRARGRGRRRRARAARQGLRLLAARVGERHVDALAEVLLGQSSGSSGRGG